MVLDVSLRPTPCSASFLSPPLYITSSVQETLSPRFYPNIDVFSFLSSFRCYKIEDIMESTFTIWLGLIRLFFPSFFFFPFVPD